MAGDVNDPRARSEGLDERGLRESRRLGNVGSERGDGVELGLHVEQPALVGVERAQEANRRPRSGRPAAHRDPGPCGKPESVHQAPPAVVQGREGEMGERLIGDDLEAVERAKGTGDRSEDFLEQRTGRSLPAIVQGHDAGSEVEDGLRDVRRLAGDVVGDCLR